MDDPECLSETARALAKSHRYRTMAQAAATVSAYAADIERYSLWCAHRGLIAIPAEPEIIGAYIAGHSGSHATGTLRRWIAAIAQATRLAGSTIDTSHPVITFNLAKSGNDRKRSARSAGAVTAERMRLLVENCEETLAGKRDKALLLIGFAGALRRSELAALQVEDINKADGGLTILIKGATAGHQSVTNRIAPGRHPATCPVRALESWPKAAEIAEGPVFRKVVRGGHVQACPLSTGGVWQIVKKRCRSVGLESGDFEYFSPQSLRAGFIESTYSAGVAIGDIIAHSRHKRPPPIRGRIKRTDADDCKFVGRIDL
ncbi:tyrosine-type recombinase/integrase [Caulobacter radicis]|uniref:Tyr recombinase domain-containing protein n=1 Tax=Caulobacter radicis TaxID=2172650 RepID=A0A2T9K0T0_9CAUL|nr:tyrosine-type recombinase/integrase [Caulobacter radicis]PVM89598.1 hypothetical protein DDF65_00340 [Caulobacter radicis]